ncbi:19192_t:CDS:2, partial [Racocetra persica]
PRDERKQNCLISIPGSSEKQELVKNDIVHLLLNTLPEKFIKDICALALTPLLTEEKILDWDLGYAMTVHTSQGMMLEAPQRVWIEGLPLPPEIEEAKNKKAIERSLRPFISEKLVRYMDQDKKKEWDEAGNPDQWTIDRINNKLGHIKGNIRLTCLECNQNYQV